MNTISLAERFQVGKSDLSARKRALQKFYKYLIQRLYYFHSQNVRYEDIKPNNILVQHFQIDDNYHVYLADE
jgi:serine/threonine protein kinase